MSKQTGSRNWRRLAFAALYFIAAAVLFHIKHVDMLYIEVRAGFYQFDRYLWCLFVSLLGFSALAFHLRDHQKSPFPEYVTYYPLVLATTSALVFSILHLFEASSGFIFYYLSFAACFILAFLIDRFWEFIIAAVGKAK